jgi:hypothetical protein
LPNDLIEEKGSKCLKLNIPNKRIYVQQPIFWNSLIMEVCLIEEVLISGGVFKDKFRKRVKLSLGGCISSNTLTSVKIARSLGNLFIFRES